MDQQQIIIMSAIGVYFLAMIIIGIFAGRNQSHEGFVIGSRDVGYIPTIGSIASSFRDGMGVIFWFGFGVTAGYGGLWLFLGVMLGLCVYVVIGPPVRKMAKERQIITIGQIIRRNIGFISEKLTSLIIVIFALMMIAIQLYVSGSIFSEVLGIPAAIGVWTVAVIVGFYLFLGGYSTVIKTDTVQFFLIISLITLPIFFPPPLEAVMDFSTITFLGLKSSIALTGIGFFYVLSSADTWQRVFSARDDKVIKFGFPISGVFLVIMTLSLIFLGMACAPHLGTAMEIDNAFFQIFSADFMSPYLLAFIAVVVMAICMSTTDTLCYLCASTIAKNFIPESVTSTRDNYIRLSQIVMIISLVVTAIIALTITDVITYLFSAISLLYILFPIYVYAVLGNEKYRNSKTDTLASLAIVVSVIIYIYMFMNHYFEDMMMTLVPVAICMVLTGGAVLIGKNNVDAGK